MRRAEERENDAEKIMALNGLAVAQSRVSPYDQCDTLAKAAAFVESIVRDGRPVDSSQAKHTFYRYGLACSAILQVVHYYLYTKSKMAGLHVTEEKGKKDQVALAVCRADRIQPTSPGPYLSERKV